MSALGHTFDALLGRGDGALIAYVCAGDPDTDFTVELIKRLSDAGADVIELGLPFSDPVADGPVIQAAMNRALSGGFSTEHLFQIARSVRALGVDRPLVVMTYFNPILQYGPKGFCRAAAEAGIDGLLVVDLPPEESAETDRIASSHGIDMIRLVAPSTTDARLESILSSASGFVYAVSAAGTTGARAELAASADPLLERTTSRTRLPVALGFGISTPSHVRAALSAGAAGVVEGSRLIETYSALLPDRADALDAVARHAREMKLATVGASQRSQPAKH